MIILLSLLSLLIGTSYGLFSQPKADVIQETQASLGEYQPKDYTHLYGMKGFSDALLKMHFQLYQGYVKNTNLLLSHLMELEKKNLLLSCEYGALKHRFGWEWDGMRLHEYYFENLGGTLPLDSKSPLMQKITANFGSYENWKQDFIATGLMRGIGWVILYQDARTGRLFNTWINEHDVGHLAGGSPLLVMDVFEHAYITEYGLDKKEYIEVFFKNINWTKVASRLPTQL